MNPRFTTQFNLEGASFILSSNSITFDEMFFFCKYKRPQWIQFLLRLTLHYNGLPCNRTICYNQIQVYSSSLNFEQNWKRFLDDRFIFLRLSLKKPNGLLDVLNNINSAIQFTMETSGTQLPFLDIIINTEGKRVFMDIYSKPTDSKRYVSFNSNHPKHCLKSIPFSLARRICMIIEKVSLKEIRLKELETLLPEQYYPKIIIKAGIDTVLKITQNKLGNVKEEKERRSYLLF